MNELGRRGKIQGKIESRDPLVVRISKNGRPVSDVNAKIFLKKHFPQIDAWQLRYTDHSLLAEKIDVRNYQ